MIYDVVVFAYIDPGSSLPILSGFLGLIGSLLMLGRVPLRLAASGLRRVGRGVRAIARTLGHGLGSFGHGLAGFARRLDL
jgi:hypothetical protein